MTTVVGRYRRDVGSSSTIGALYAGREGEGYHNRQIGADLFWRPTQSDAFRVQYIRSDTQYPEAVARRPRPADGGLRRQRHVDRLPARHGEVDGVRQLRGLRLGIPQRHGLRAAEWTTGRSPGRPSGAGSAARGRGSTPLDVGVRGWRTTTDDWDLTRPDGGGVRELHGARTRPRFSSTCRATSVVYEGMRYEYYRPNVYFGIKPSGRTALSVRGRFGDGVDYANNRAATSVVQVAPAVEYRPASRVSLQLSYNLDQLSVDGGRLYRANLGAAQGASITSTSARSCAPFCSTPTSAATRTCTCFPSSSAPGASSRSTSSPSSSTRRPCSSPATRTTPPACEGVDLQQQNRTFFVKLGYAWAF